MPKGTIDYSKSFIYKLCCKDVNIKDIYVGSTTNMRTRKMNHKKDCHNENSKGHNRYVYHFIREHGGFNNWEMVLVEAYCATDNMDLRKRERYWTEELKGSLHTNLPYSTDEEKNEQKKEHYEDNKNQYLERAKNYYEENKEYKLQYQKQYSQKNKEKIAENQKQYRLDNKEKLAEQKKQYREDNKERFYRKITCECGSIYNNSHKNRHEKTDKHLKYLEISIVKG